MFLQQLAAEIRAPLWDRLQFKSYGLLFLKLRTHHNLKNFCICIYPETPLVYSRCKSGNKRNDEWHSKNGTFIFIIPSKTVATEKKKFVLL